jgi:phage terminase large subunit-like protein
VVIAAPASAVTTYAEQVRAGEIIAGPFVRLACERHLRDLERDDVWFDDDAAERAFQFFERFLRLGEGEFAGEPFVLQPFQKFIVGSLFGWKGRDGYRRFRKAYVEIGKGNGKSPLAAGIGLYGLIADGEAGAEIYSAAVNRDQAGILFRDAKLMVESSPALSHRVDVNVGNLAFAKTNSFFRPVSSEARSLDGKRVFIALIDELHEHRTSMVVEKMQAGTKGRRQPLIFEITNSGYDKTSVCYQHHLYSRRVLEGIVEDDGWFAYICALDDGDDWADPDVWIKANPNLGISITKRYLEEQVREAQGMPSKQNIVKRLNFCIWTEQAERWIDMSRWDACAGPVYPETLVGRECFGGLDLAGSQDITAFLAAFPGMDGESYDYLAKFWMPEAVIAEAEKRDGVPYRLWVEQGYIELTEGNITDYDAVRDGILEFASRYQVNQIGFDPWNALHLSTQLRQEGATMVQISQGYASMSEPTQAFERLIKGGKIRHGDNPVLNWMASNAVVAHGPNESIRPEKAKATGRIDGIVAAIMALKLALIDEGDTTAPRTWSFEELPE